LFVGDQEIIACSLMRGGDASHIQVVNDSSAHIRDGGNTRNGWSIRRLAQGCACPLLGGASIHPIAGHDRGAANPKMVSPMTRGTQHVT
jgi:hypothetical protein